MAGNITLAPEITAKSRYSSMEQDRNPYLVRARECAALTIPSILPAQGFSASSSLPTPYQSLGARGVRTMASKFLMTMFPTIPFFQYKIDDQSLNELGSQRGETEKALASRERAVALELDTCLFRPAAFVLLSHLIVTGNGCIYIPPAQEERARVFRLDQYVVRRDPSGNLLEFVIVEPLDFQSIPIKIRPLITSLDAYKSVDPAKLEEQPFELFTHGYLDAETGKWIVYQEIEGIRLEGTDGSYKNGELPYLFPRLSYQPNEDYGRSYVEEYLGDLDSLEALTETLVEGSAASARVVFLVNPAGTTSLKVVTEAKNGDVVAGSADDVHCMQVNKQADLSVAKQQTEEIAARLSYAFLFQTSIQRKGERVTAQEIRYMATELDDALGGVYTLLTADLQLPAVRLFERRMEKRLKAPPLPGNIVKPVIVAGLEGIGRGHDLANLKAFAADIIGVLTPEIAKNYMKPAELIARAAAAYGIDTEGLIPTEEEIAQNQQQQQLLALVQHLGPEGIKQMGGMGNTMLKQGAPPAQ